MVQTDEWHVRDLFPNTTIVRTIIVLNWGLGHTATESTRFIIGGGLCSEPHAKVQLIPLHDPTPQVAKCHGDTSPAGSLAKADRLREPQAALAAEGDS